MVNIVKQDVNSNFFLNHPNQTNTIVRKGDPLTGEHGHEPTLAKNGFWSNAKNEGPYAPENKQINKLSDPEYK